MIRISFIGDIGLHNGPSQPGFNHLKAVEQIKPYLHASDYVVGNLESSKKCKDNYNPNKKPLLISSTSAYNLLREIPVNLLGLANNHVGDTLDQGFIETKSRLAELNIDSFGAGIDKEDNVFKCKINGKIIAFLNYCHRDTGIKEVHGSRIKYGYYELNRIKNDIQILKKEVDYLFLYLHWGGNTDYGHFPEMQQVQDARFFIDQGADGVIGNHAHAIQPIEYYKGKPIAYCQGHFIFDDIIFEGKKTLIRPSGKEGYILHLQIKNDEIKIDKTGYKIIDLKLVPNKSIERKLLMINLYFKLYKRIPPLRLLYHLYLEKIEPKLFLFQMREKSVYTKVLELLRLK